MKRAIIKNGNLIENSLDITNVDAAIIEKLFYQASGLSKYYNDSTMFLKINGKKGTYFIFSKEGSIYVVFPENKEEELKILSELGL
jgi:hypothetical protein